MRDSGTTFTEHLCQRRGSTCSYWSYCKDVYCTYIDCRMSMKTGTPTWWWLHLHRLVLPVSSWNMARLNATMVLHGDVWGVDITWVVSGLNVWHA